MSVLEFKYPQRFVNEQYMGPTSPFRIFRHTLRQSSTLHWHEFYELCFIIAGEGTHMLNGTAHPLGPGSLFLLTPVDFHELFPLPGASLDLFNLIFSDEMLDEELRRLLFSEIENYHITFLRQDSAAIETEFRRIWAEAQEWKIGHRRIVQGALERILIDLARHCLTAHDPTRRQQVASHPAIRDALLYIHHHFRSPLTLPDVAQQVHLTPNYFSECFHKTTGVSFQSYVQSLRLRLALSLLSVSVLSVTDICLASGFNTMSHFDRAFKQKFGQSPRSYRRTLAASPDHIGQASAP